MRYKILSRYSKYIAPLAFLFVMFSLSLALGTNTAQAGGFHFTGDAACGNFILDGHHYWGGYGPGSPACTILGTDFDDAVPCTTPPPACPDQNYCQDGNVWQEYSSCYTQQYQVCLSGCGGDSCKAVTSTSTCVQNSQCISKANACGLTDGVMSCASNVCVAPPNSECTGLPCTGPDGSLVQNGESRLYYTSTTDCSESQADTCTNGVLSGSPLTSAYKDSVCNNGTGNLPIIQSFHVTPTDVEQGDSCKMIWEVDKADDCSISGPGIQAGGWNAALPTGALNTPPINATSQYMLTCTNTAGIATSTAICHLNPDVTEH